MNLVETIASYQRKGWVTVLSDPARKRALVHRNANRGIDHGFHAILTFMTCGLWVLPWMLCYLAQGDSHPEQWVTLWETAEGNTLAAPGNVIDFYDLEGQ